MKARWRIWAVRWPVYDLTAGKPLRLIGYSGFWHLMMQLRGHGTVELCQHAHKSRAYAEACDDARRAERELKDFCEWSLSRGSIVPG